MPPDIEVCALQFPGREERFREVPFTDVHALVAALSRVLYPYELSRPFAFYGHSMGAIVAYELAQLLQRQYGLSPLHLFVSARNAPHIVDPRPALYALPDREFLDELRRLDGTPRELLDNPDPAWLHLLRADFAVNEAYRFGGHPPLPVGISAYGGRTDPRVATADIEPWRQHTSAAFAFRLFESGHFFVQEERAQVVSAVLLTLARATF
jgi:medium-chain acyl-[acyl-carrier-protein] hydrolase